MARPSNKSNRGFIIRWYQNLRPDLDNDRWSREELQDLFDFYEKYGNQWKKIASKIEHRSDNAVKNTFFSCLRKGFRNLLKFCKANKKITATDLINKIKPNVMLELTKKSIRLLNQENGKSIGEMKIIELLKRVCTNKYSNLNLEVLDCYKLYIHQITLLLERMNKKYNKVGLNFIKLKEFKQDIIIIRVNPLIITEEDNLSNSNDFYKSKTLRVKKIAKKGKKTLTRKQPTSKKPSNKPSTEIEVYNKGNDLRFVLRCKEERKAYKSPGVHLTADPAKEQFEREINYNIIPNSSCKILDMTSQPKSIIRRVIQAVDMNQTNKMLRRARIQNMRCLIQRSFKTYI